MRTNHFLAALRGGAPQLGLWVNFGDPAAVEIAASSGFDWLLLDNEHAPRPLDTTVRNIVSAEAHRTPAIVRVRELEGIGPLLDAGCQSLLVPMVETAEQARAITRACEFPPRGTRGVSSQTRAGSWGRDPGFLAGARSEICLIVQIESALGVRNVETILGVEGVDAVFVGPADLAATLGHLGEPGHPSVREAVGQVTAAAQAHGIPLGTLTRDVDSARDHLEQGFAFVGVGTDTALFARALADLRRNFS
ncbi:HpcH/HpaI aldolase/citrate lyase family protein [Actinomadura sp. LOL_016]|uniref:HpcH/HpaI aldolase family protein n=1 Tax=unclassified Actinomadura TaxID=2626254 RepID=UPI003A7FAA79